MDTINHDYEIERQAHPENMEYISVEEASVESELFCPNDRSRLMEYPTADGPDDYHMVAYCLKCDYITE